MAKRSAGRREGQNLVLQTLPIALSAGALLLSAWTLYYKDLSDRNHLVVSSVKLSLPMLPATADDENFRGTMTGRFLATNGGNRTAAVLSAGVQLVPQMVGKVRPGNVVCHQPIMPGTITVSIKGPNLPAVVDPGKIIDIPYSADLDFDWDEMMDNRQVETCIVFAVLDSNGVRHSARFPFSSIGFYKEDDPKHGPGYSIPQPSFRLM